LQEHSQQSFLYHPQQRTTAVTFTNIIL